MKKVVAFLLTALMLITLAACGNTPQDGENGNSDGKVVVDDKVYEIKLTSNDAPTTIWMKNMQAAADAVYQITDGHVDIQVYGNGEMMIGDEGRKAVLSDAAIMLFCDPGECTQVPEWAAMCAPYLWNDWTEVVEFEKTDMFAQLLQKGQDANLHIVGDSLCVVGVRNVMSNYPIHTLADLQAQTLRWPGSAFYCGIADALGGNYQGMAMSETYNAIETGMVDGCENTTGNFAANGIADSLKTPYYSLTQHVVCMVSLTCGQGFWDSLPQEYQQVITEQFAASIANSNQEVADSEASLRAQLESDGVTIVEIEDLSEFKAAVQPFCQSLTMYDEIAAAVENMRG